MDPSRAIRTVLMFVVACAAYVPAQAATPVAEPEVKRTAEELLRAAQQADSRGQWAKAEQAASAAIEQNANLAVAYYLRGRARFCLSKFAASVEDFDRYVKLNPGAASRQWERGISCYYAEKFAEGADQFKLYQTYHDNDVENSVWRYLCMARIKTEGVERARAAILPIRNDRRVGMMKVYDLYRGKATVEDVLQATKPPADAKDTNTGPLFYARLYIGLFHEAAGNHEAAANYIRLAAEEHQDDAARGRVNHYMYEVAVVHHRMITAKANK